MPRPPVDFFNGVAQSQWYCGLLLAHPPYPYYWDEFPKNIFPGYQLSLVNPTEVHIDNNLQEFSYTGKVEFYNGSSGQVTDIWGMFLISNLTDPETLLYIWEFNKPEEKNMPPGTTIYDFSLLAIGWNR